MKKLASASGIVIYEVGSKLYISKRQGNWTSTFLFVTGLITVIAFVNGLLQLFAFREKLGSEKIAIILLIIAAFLGLLFWRVWLYRKKVFAIPYNELQTVAIIDLETKNLRDDQDRVISPLHHVHMDRKMQLTSSSPELILRWKDGFISLVKGNPFSGGISSIEKILISKGIRK